MRNVTEQKGKNGRTSYLIRVSAGYDTNGRQIKKSLTWRPSPGMTARQIEKELERQAVLFEDKVKGGFVLDGNTRFSEFAEKFIETKELSPKCKKRYIDLLKRINEAIGHIRLEKLQPHHLQEFYGNLREVTSKRTGERLSDKTILHYHRLISSILARACKEQIIPRNIASRDFMDAPKVAKKEPAYLDDIQAREVVGLLYEYDDIRVRTAVLILIYTGIRRGELCGLEWGDLDYENNIISINCAAQYVKGIGIITKVPKNDTSVRSIKIAPDIISLLRQYQAWQARQKFALGEKWVDYLNFNCLEGTELKVRPAKNDRIFTSDDGGLISPDTINSWLERFRERNNLTQFTPHSLRRTNITLQIAAGAPLRTVAARAGHAQLVDDREYIRARHKNSRREGVADDR